MLVSLALLPIESFSLQQLLLCCVGPTRESWETDTQTHTYTHIKREREREHEYGGNMQRIRENGREREKKRENKIQEQSECWMNKMSRNHKLEKEQA